MSGNCAPPLPPAHPLAHPVARTAGKGVRHAVRHHLLRPHRALLIKSVACVATALPSFLPMPLGPGETPPPPVLLATDHGGAIFPGAGEATALLAPAPSFGTGAVSGPGVGTPPLPPTIKEPSFDTPRPPAVSAPEPSGLLIMTTALALFHLVRARAQRANRRGANGGLPGGLEQPLIR